MSSRTVEGRLLDGLPGLAADDMQLRRRLLQRWKRRSLVVRILRRLLPTLCVLIVLGLAGWATINTFFWRTSFGQAGAGIEIRMVRPAFKGRNDDGKPFLLSASSAVRDSTDASRVTLEDPVFTLGSVADDKTVVTARHGVYREDTRILDLRGSVTLEDAQGYHFASEHALVNTVKSEVDGEGRIEGYGPLGRIAASSYSVRGGGAHVYFTGKVKTHIEHSATRAVSPPAAKKD